MPLAPVNRISYCNRWFHRQHTDSTDSSSSTISTISTTTNTTIIIVIISSHNTIQLFLRRCYWETVVVVVTLRNTRSLFQCHHSCFLSRKGGIDATVVEAWPTHNKRQRCPAPLV